MQKRTSRSSSDAAVAPLSEQSALQQAIAGRAVTQPHQGPQAPQSAAGVYESEVAEKLLKGEHPFDECRKTQDYKTALLYGSRPSAIQSIGHLSIYLMRKACTFRQRKETEKLSVGAERQAGDTEL